MGRPKAPKCIKCPSSRAANAQPGKDVCLTCEAKTHAVATVAINKNVQEQRKQQQVAAKNFLMNLVAKHQELIEIAHAEMLRRVAAEKLAVIDVEKIILSWIDGRDSAPTNNQVDYEYKTVMLRHANYRRVTPIAPPQQGVAAPQPPVQNVVPDDAPDNDDDNVADNAVFDDAPFDNMDE